MSGRGRCDAALKLEGIGCRFHGIGVAQSPSWDHDAIHLQGFLSAGGSGADCTLADVIGAILSGYRQAAAAFSKASEALPFFS